jgi:hydrogenase maturation factor
MDIKALQFESRFSLPPNSLGYCGRNTAAAKFKRCISESNCEDVEDEVKKFIVLYPYLQTISQIVNLPAFSYEILESYWIGNNLLKKEKQKDYKILLDNFLKQGVPDFFVEELRHKLPKIFIPNHLFHVLHVGVGKASGAVPFNLETINHCMIRWGKVEELRIVRQAHYPEQSRRVQSSKLRVKVNYLEQKKNKYILKQKNESVKFDNKLLGEVKIGDMVAVHWKMVIKKLTKEEEKKLKFWTDRVLDSI